jgi:DNA-binding HxlR family transcriptional regulator
MKRGMGKSHCPVNFALEVFGDPWTLLIVRDIVFWGRKTYSEFLESREHISTNILADRLAHLEREGIITKKPHPTDRRKEVYSLTKKGLAIIPALLELSGWSTTFDPLSTAPRDFVALVYANRDQLFKVAQDTVARGGSLFVGPDSVVAQLPSLKLNPPAHS